MVEHRLAFIDLDGVIADDRHRVQYALDRQWYEYFDLMGDDKVWPQGQRLYEDCHLAGFDVAYLTGRREDTRRKTERWLKAHGFDHTLPLIMRKQEDRRRLAEVKKSVVAEAMHIYEDGVWMYDDDPEVIEQVRTIPGARARHCTWHIKPKRLVKKAIA